MPAEVKRTIVSTKIQPGDEVMYGDRRFYARMVAVKQKYTHVSIDNGLSVRIPIDHEVVVMRIEATQEERDQVVLDMMIEHVSTEINDAPERVEKSRVKLIEALKNAPRYHLDEWTTYARAQIFENIWERVATVARIDNVDLRTAALLVRDQIAERVLSGLELINVSTDQGRNYANNLETQVMVDWMNTLRFFVR
jgi:hypothetical protein